MLEKNQSIFFKRGKRMKVFVNGCEFKNWKILDGYLYIECGFGYTLANASGIRLCCGDKRK